MILPTEKSNPTNSAPEAATGPWPSRQRARAPALEVLLPPAAGEPSAAMGAESPAPLVPPVRRRTTTSSPMADSSTTGSTPGAAFRVLCRQASRLTLNPAPSTHNALQLRVSCLTLPSVAWPVCQKPGLAGNSALPPRPRSSVVTPLKASCPWGRELGRKYTTEREASHKADDKHSAGTAVSRFPPEHLITSSAQAWTVPHPDT